MNRRQDLTARNIPSAQDELGALGGHPDYDHPGSAYQLAFTDGTFLLREGCARAYAAGAAQARADAAEQGVQGTIVIFGSARILPRDTGRGSWPRPKPAAPPTPSAARACSST